MFTVNDKAVKGNETGFRKSSYDLSAINAAKNSRMRSYSRYNLEDEVAEEEKAAMFNANISDNYRRLIGFDKPLNNKDSQNAFQNQEISADSSIGRLIVEDLEVEEEITTPTATTMQFIELNKDEFKPANRERENISIKSTARAKLIFLVYAVVIVALFTLVILNTRALKSLNQNITELETQMQALSAESAELTNNLNDASSDETVKKWAQEILGMVESN